MKRAGARVQVTQPSPHIFMHICIVRVSELVRPQKSFAAAVASASDSFVKLNHARGAMRTDEQDNFRHSIQARPPLKGGRKRVRERGAKVLTVVKKTNPRLKERSQMRLNRRGFDCGHRQQNQLIPNVR